MKAHIGVEGNAAKKSSTEKVIKVSYRVEEFSTSSSGVGTDAEWQFKQGGASGRRAQYPLNIVFKMEKIGQQIRDDLYYATPNITINGHVLDKEEDGSSIEPIRIKFLYYQKQP